MILDFGFWNSDFGFWKISDDSSISTYLICKTSPTGQIPLGFNFTDTYEYSLLPHKFVNIDTKPGKKDIDKKYVDRFGAKDEDLAFTWLLCKLFCYLF